MTIKDVILTILCYCGLRFVDKLIEDNLPNLHYKNIVKVYYNYVVPFILIGYMGVVVMQVKVFGNKEDQKNLQNTLILIAVAIAFYQAYKNKNSLNKKIPATNED